MLNTEGKQMYKKIIIVNIDSEIFGKQCIWILNMTKTIIMTSGPTLHGKSKGKRQNQWQIYSFVVLVQFTSDTQLCLTDICDPMNCSTPGLPVNHQLPEFTQTHVHRVSDAIKPSHLLSPPSPPALNHFQHSIQFSSVAQSCLTHSDTVNHNMPGLSVHHQLPELTQTHVHCVGDAIQSSHSLLSPSPPALDLSQHYGIFKWVSSSHEVAKVLEFQL